MRPPQSVWFPITIVLAGLSFLVLWKPGVPETPGSAKVEAVSPPAATTQSRMPDPGFFFTSMPDGADHAVALKHLGNLQSMLAAMPPDQAAEWIRGFLAAGHDKPTGLSFEIGTAGKFKEWPTFRTFLLDALLTIDPAAAAEISRGILAAPTTADEWALALRNVGRAETADETRDFLRRKAEELIQNPAWQANPSIGYLNAFDVLVHAQAAESTPLLSNLVQNKDRKDLAHAAFLTLDRLVQQAPVAMLENLAADTALQQSRPEMTAQQFARADLRDATQREIVKSWLLDPARTDLELRSFAGVYPNNNRFVSNNLLTNETPPSGASLTAHDREALRILDTWREDPEFGPVLKHLSAMTARLEQFTRVTPIAEP